MSNRIKSIIALLLAASLMVMVPACKGKDTGSESTSSVLAESVESQTEPESEGGEASATAGSDVSVAGTPSTAASKAVTIPKKTVTIKFASCWGQWEYGLPAGTNEGSDLYTKKFKEIKDKYNAEIVVESLDAATIDIVSKAIMAGDSPYDIMELDLVSARRMALNGALYDQSTIKSINLNAPQFSATKAVSEDVTYKGKVYGSQYGFPIDSVMGVFVNVSLLSRLKQPDVKQLYKNNQWDWAHFEEIAKNVSRDTDGDSENDIWGLACDSHVVGMAIGSNAGGTVLRSASGAYTVGMTSDNGIEALNWIRKLYITDKSYNFFPSGAHDVYPDFTSGKVAFFPMYLVHLNSFGVEMKDDLTFLPFPKGPKQPTYINGVHQAKVFAMPKTLKDPEYVGMIYQELSTVSNELNKIYEKRMRNFGLDEAGITTAMSMTKYMCAEFARGIDVSSFEKKMTDSIFSSNGNPSTTLVSVRSQFQKAVDDYYAKVK